MKLSVWALRGLLVLLIMCSVAGAAQSAPMLSGNVSMDSYVYDHLEKLSGLGLLQPMLTGSKPYNRLQVAGWVLEMEKALGKQKNPSWLGKSLVADLRKEFAKELSRLATGNRLAEPKVQEWKLGLDYYNGKSAGYPVGRGTFQPLHKNSQGYRWDQGMNAFGSFQWEGAMGPDAWISLTPRIAWGEQNGAGATLQSGYVKLRSGNTEFLVGKDAMSWGQGQGNLLLSDNATPLTRFQIANIEPLHYRGWLRHLGNIQTKVFFAVLEDREFWDHGGWRDHDKPGLYGMRLDFQTAPDFTIGFGYTSMFGGRGIHMGTGDYFRLIMGKTNNETGDFASGQAGGDFRWRFPKWGGLQLYGGYYSEDNIDYNEWGKSKNVGGTVAGIYIPRLSPSGDWDLTLEAAGTGFSWYDQFLYPAGHTYGGQIIGDPMGGNANRYSMRLKHYMNSRTQVGLTLERVVQGASLTVSQRVDSIALSVRHRLANDLLMEFSGGLANLDNAGFSSGVSRKNKFVSWSISQRF